MRKLLFVVGLPLLLALPSVAHAQGGGSLVVRFASSVEETFEFDNPESRRVLVMSYSDGFQCTPTVTFLPPIIQRVTTPGGDTHQLNTRAPMYARVYGPALGEEFAANPCAFIQDTSRLIAEGVVYIHAADNEFMGPLIFIPGPGPGARTINVSWMGRLRDLVNGGFTNVSLHGHILFSDDALLVLRFRGPYLTPDPLDVRK